MLMERPSEAGQDPQSGQAPPSTTEQVTMPNALSEQTSSGAQGLTSSGADPSVHNKAEEYEIDHLDSGSLTTASEGGMSRSHLRQNMARKLKEHLRTGVALYELPKARYKWGQKQGEAHHVWASLFFDLVYVAIAFQLGHVLADGIKAETTVGSVGLALSMFSALEMCWQVKMGMDSRYHIDDLVHRVHQIALGACLALAANAIASLEEMDVIGSKHAITFSSCLFAFLVIECIPYIEMAAFAKEENVLGAAWYGIVSRIMLLLVSAASIVTSIYAPLYATCILWFIMGNFLRLFILALNVFKLQKKNKSVPMHVKWAISRYLEFNLLMIGESVISIIISLYSNTANFIATFIMCFGLIATLAMIMFASSVDNDDHHALRRSSVRAGAYLVLQTSQSFTLICVGVGFKLILGKTESSYVPLDFIWFMSSSLVINIAAFLCGRVLHHGFHEEFLLFPKRSQRVKKMVFWSLKVSVLGITFVAAAMKPPAWGLMLWYWGICALIYFLQLVDLKTFEAYHAERVEAEVKAREEAYKKEGFVVTKDVERGKDKH